MKYIKLFNESFDNPELEEISIMLKQEVSDIFGNIIEFTHELLKNDIILIKSTSDVDLSISKYKKLNSLLDDTINGYFDSSWIKSVSIGDGYNGDHNIIYISLFKGKWLIDLLDSLESSYDEETNSIYYKLGNKVLIEQDEEREYIWVNSKLIWSFFGDKTSHSEDMDISAILKDVLIKYFSNKEHKLEKSFHVWYD